jgi:hypothetical protein
MTARTCCLDSRDGLACTCMPAPSWKAPRPRTPSQARTGQSWHTPGRRRLPLPLLLIGVLLAVGFLIGLDEARAYLCQVHEGQLDYCTAYPPNEETP